MKNYFNTFLPVLFLSLTTFAQDYWQQAVAYDIEVTLEDNKHFLHAFESIEYTNNSPDELNEIYMHIWPNAYKNLNTAMAKQLLRNGNTTMYFLDESERGYIDSLDFQVNGTKINWEYHPEHIDIAILKLNTSLKPGEKISISTPFRVKLPSGKISRLGHIDQSYQITQWYPKPAVYDKNGWNAFPYLTQGEFYSEYGTFDVKITLPKNYVLGATGDMQGEAGRRELEWLNEKAKATEKISSFEDDMTFPASDSETKTIHFHQENVHDFGWFADKRWHVLKGEVKLPHSGKYVTTWAFFTNSEANLWSKSIEYLNDATYYYSLWNGDYPYNHVTAVDGTISAGGGMEYPNITVIGSSGSAFGLETVIMHEVGHNWFYGILGSNERTHAWMDEGLNSYNEKRYLTTKYPDASVSKMVGLKTDEILGKKLPKYKDIYWLQYYFAARSISDQPIETHSDEFSSVNYGVIVYAKTAASMHYLANYLGQSKFDECMQTYYRKWKFKHPQPSDLQKVFEEETGEDLNWFFNDLIQKDLVLDYKIANVKNHNDSLFIGIKNKGKLASPFSITAYSKGVKIAKAWYQGVEDYTVVNFPKGDYDKLIINAENETTEIYHENNNYNTKSIFNKVEPIKFEFLGNIEDPRKNQVYWSPVIGWNQVDGGQFGVALYNQFLPKEKFSWHFMPLLSNKSKSLNGAMGIQYTWRRPTSFINKSTLGYKMRKYGFSTVSDDITNFYAKSNLYLNIQLKSKPNKAFKHFLNFETSNIIIDNKTLIEATNTLQNSFSEFAYGRVEYLIKNKKALFPQTLRLRFENNGANRLNAEYKWSKIYHNVKKAKISNRTFVGTIFGSNSTITNYKLSGWRGYQDLMMDHFYVNRGSADLSNLYARQMTLNDGGFASPFFLGQTNWMISNNLFIELPYFKMLRGFVNTAYLPNVLDPGKNTFEYEMGLQLNVIKDKFTVYFPLVLSQNLENSVNAITNSYGERIRFTLNLETISLFNLIDNIEL